MELKGGSSPPGRLGPSNGRESIQWNWKRHPRRPPSHNLRNSESIQWNWKARAPSILYELLVWELEESIQWNWKGGFKLCPTAGLNTTESIQWNWKSRGLGLPCTAWLGSWNPFNGIERIFLTTKVLASVNRIHSMELKESPLDITRPLSPSSNPFNGIESCCKPGIVLWGEEYRNPFNGIESSRSPSATATTLYHSGESIQWNWKLYYAAAFE